jgi:hypothetical protein
LAVRVGGIAAWIAIAMAATGIAVMTGTAAGIMAAGVAPNGFSRRQSSIDQNARKPPDSRGFFVFNPLT